MGRVDVVNEIHRNKDFFSEKWIEFCQWVEDYGEHAEKCMNDPQLRIDTKKIMQFNSKCRELYRQSNELAHKFNEATRKGDHIAAKRCVKLMHKKEAELAKLKPQPQPPEPDYVRHNYTNFHHLNISGGHVFWIKPGPVNPLLWFALFGNAGNQREPNDKERLIIDCIILTVVHDYGGDLDYSEETITDRFNPYSGRYFKRDNFCWALLDKLNQSDGERRMQRAFERVKADLKEYSQTVGNNSMLGRLTKVAQREHREFLLEIVNSLSKLIIGNPDNRKRFEQRIQAFRKTKDKFDWALKKAHKAAKNKPRLQEEKARPGADWELICMRSPGNVALLYGKGDPQTGLVEVWPDEVRPLRFWARGLPFNPVGWLEYRYAYQRGWLGPKPKEPQDKQQRLFCDYALLAVIYDKALDIPACDRLTDSDPNEWAELLWVSLSAFGYEGKGTGYSNRKDRIKTAFDDVQADLTPKAPRETARRTKKVKKLEKRFKHWTDSSDACFLIENNRTQFHYNGNIKDLRLKHGSRTDELLKWLQSGPSSSQVIKEKLCSEGTRPSDLAAYANKTLNDKIAKVGFVGIPQDVEFIKYSKLTNDYESVLKIFTSREELERHQLQQPLVDDRGYKERDDAEQEY